MLKDKSLVELLNLLQLLIGQRNYSGNIIVSRATDVDGTMQSEEADLQTKKSRWENNAQFVRKFKV